MTETVCSSQCLNHLLSGPGENKYATPRSSICCGLTVTFARELLPLFQRVGEVGGKRMSTVLSALSQAPPLLHMGAKERPAEIEISLSLSFI